MRTAPVIVKANYVNSVYRPRRKPRGGTAPLQRAPRPVSPRALLVKHLRYLEHRPKGEQETRESRQLFSADRDRVSCQDALEAILANAQASRAFYRLVLSPNGQDEAVWDWRDFTRRVLADYQERLGVPLVWVAAHHANTEHEHVHVVLSGGYADPRGQLRALRLGAEDFAALRQIGRAHTEASFRMHLVTQLEAEERQERADAAHRAAEQHLMSQQAAGRSQLTDPADRAYQEDRGQRLRRTAVEEATSEHSPKPMKERAALRAYGLPLTAQDRARLTPSQSAAKAHLTAAPDPQQRSRPTSHVPPSVQAPSQPRLPRQGQPGQQPVHARAGGPRPQQTPARTRTRRDPP